MLNLFSLRVNEILKQSSCDLEILQGLRDILKNSLSDREFRISCVTAVIRSIQEWSDENKLWNAPPLITDVTNNYSLRMIYWPSYFDVNPHEHKTWGVTGIFQNEVDVNIFELHDGPPRRLKKTNTIIARQGEVGYVQSGCIHNISNNTGQLASTLHIFNNLPGVDNPEENAIWYPSPRKFNISSELKNIALSSCLSTLKELSLVETVNLINDIYTLGSRSVKFQAIDVLCTVNPAMARSLFDGLCFDNLKTDWAA